MSQSHRVEADLGDGRKFVFESGWIAKQANGACMPAYRGVLQITSLGDNGARDPTPNRSTSGVARA